jgi:hypothetical protein
VYKTWANDWLKAFAFYPTNWPIQHNNRESHNKVHIVLTGFLFTVYGSVIIMQHVLHCKPIPVQSVKWQINSPHNKSAEIYLEDRVFYETSCDSKQPKLEPKLVSTLSDTRCMFRLFRFNIEATCFGVSIKPKQTEKKEACKNPKKLWKLKNEATLCPKWKDFFPWSCFLPF